MSDNKKCPHCGKELTPQGYANHVKTCKESKVVDFSDFDDGRPYPFLRSRKKFEDMTQQEYNQYQAEKREYEERKWQNIEEQKKAQREKDRILRITHGRYASLDSIPQEEKGDFIAK